MGDIKVQVQWAARGGNAFATIAIAVTVANTYGGDTNAGFAANALISQAVADGVKVTCDVIAICASAGTYILLACPVRRIASHASVMIHEAEAWAGGRAED